MNEKTRIQIEEMKKQTIGVEVEMNSIDRSRAAKVAAEFFGTGRYENTAHRNGYSTPGTQTAGSGNFRRMFPFPARTAKNASWSPQS